MLRAYYVQLGYDPTVLRYSTGRDPKAAIETVLQTAPRPFPASSWSRTFAYTWEIRDVSGRPTLGDGGSPTYHEITAPVVSEADS